MLALFFRKFSRRYSKEELTIIKFINRRFGYRLNDIDLFKRALTHKSISNAMGEEISNERLEFLGDAILDSIIAEFLFLKFPEEDEGYLTKVKSKLVSRRTLGIIGREMEINQVLRYNRARSIKLETIEGNAFEALIAAVYIDGGYKNAKKCINQHIFKKYVDLNQVLEEEIDFKSKLFIWSQKNRLPLDFEVIEEVNQGTNWKYLVCVKINGHEYGRGSGTSKKSAEQVAAKETLALVGEV